MVPHLHQLLLMIKTHWHERRSLRLLWSHHHARWWGLLKHLLLTWKASWTTKWRKRWLRLLSLIIIIILLLYLRSGSIIDRLTEASGSMTYALLDLAKLLTLIIVQVLVLLFHLLEINRRHRHLVVGADSRDRKGLFWLFLSWWRDWMIPPSCLDPRLSYRAHGLSVGNWYIWACWQI